MRILYVSPFTAEVDDLDSGVIGYGATSGDALVRALHELGHTIRIVPRRSPERTKLQHVYATYSELSRRRLTDFDCILMYNTHHQFASEVRRLLYERRVRDIVLAAYSHGSHWDTTDLIRCEYPMLKFADLGNLLSLDLALLVSEYMLDAITSTLSSRLGTSFADDFARRAAVVGLTIDTVRLDRARCKKSERPTIVFNHSPTAGKRPAEFFKAARHVLAERRDVSLLVTRRFRARDPGYVELRALRRQYRDRVVLGDTMPIDAYFKSLWRSHIQASSASHESFGVSTVEAIYAGCCSVVPARGSYPEITESAGVYGEGELADALLMYLDDDSARAATAERQRRAIARYAPDKVGARVADAIAGAARTFR